MTAPEHPPPGGPPEPARSARATALLWVATVGLYWPVWLWRTYGALAQLGRDVTRSSAGPVVLLELLPALNLLGRIRLSADLPRAIRRGRGQAGGEPPDTEMLTILLLVPLAAGAALAFALDLSLPLGVLLTGYLGWPFALPAALAADRLLGELRPTWKTHERRRDAVGAVVTACAAVATALIVLTGGDGEQAPAPGAAQPPLPDVSDIAVTRNALWITNSTRGTVLKLDPRTRDRLAPPLRVGREPIDIGARENGVWVANYKSGTVVRIDPAADQLREPIETGRGPFGIAVTRNAVWVSNQVERTVSRIDPETNEVVGRPVIVGRGPRGVAVRDGAVWVATGEGTGVSTFPIAQPPRRARNIRLGRFAHDVAVAGEFVWVTSPQESLVTRIDLQTKRVVGSVTVPGGPTTIESGFGLVWVLTEAGTVMRLDPRSGDVVGRATKLGGRASDLIVGDDAVWVLRGDGKVRRLPPPR